MSCSDCKDKALYKFGSIKKKLCENHKMYYHKIISDDKFENCDSELTESQFESLKKKSFERTKMIKAAKNEINLKSKNLMKLIETGLNEVSKKFDEMIIKYNDITKYNTFFPSDIPDIEDIISNEFHILPFDFDEINNEIKRIYSQTLAESTDKLTKLKNNFFHQHSGGFRCGAINESNKIFITGGFDTVIRVWDLNKKIQRFVLKGHSSVVRRILLLNDSEHLISGSFDGTVRIWSIRNRSEIALLKKHTSAIRGLCFLESDSVIISGDKEGILNFWDFQTHNFIKEASIADQIGCLEPAKNQSSLYIGLSTKIMIYDLKTSTTPKYLEGHNGIVWCICLKSNEEIMASGSGDLSIILWNLKENKQIMNFVGHTSSINSLVFTTDENFIVSGSDDKTVRIWSIESGEEVKKFNHNSFVTCIINYKQTFLALYWDSKIRTFDQNDTDNLENSFLSPFQSDNVNFAEDLNLVGYGSGNEAVIWNVESGSEEKILKGHKSEVKFVEISKDGWFAISGSIGPDENLIYWNLKNNKKIASLKGHSDTVFCGSFSEDSLTAATGSFDKTVRTWNLKNKSYIRTFNGPQKPVYSIKFVNKNSNLLVAGGEDMTIFIWNVTDGSQYAVLTGHRSVIRKILVTEDYKYIVSCGHFEGIRIWEVELKKFNHSFNSQTEAVAWLRENKIKPDSVSEYLLV